MNSRLNHGLTHEQLTLILNILAPYSDCIEEVGLFGSRAMGNYQPYSDIDIVLYGNVDKDLVAHLWTRFDSSFLPMKVDIHAYDLIDYEPLKAHIDEVKTILFTHSDLLKANKFLSKPSI